jgi:hypothetical protein
MDAIEQCTEITRLFEQATAHVRQDISFEIACIVNGALVRYTRPPDTNWETIYELGRRISYCMTGMPLSGCAIGAYPYGSDIYVAAIGLSAEACDEAAQYIADCVVQALVDSRLA